MLPNSNNKKSSFKNDKQLIETAGNPNASESEWLEACENLGDFQPKSARKPSRRTKVIAALAVLATVGFGTLGVSTLQQAHQVPAVVAISPVPAPPAQVDVDFGPYMADLQRQIKRNWFPPKGQESKRVVAIFKIGKNGELSNLKIDRSSGTEIADQAALKAVERASSSFHSLPEGAPSHVDIQFTFDYNVFSHSNHRRRIAVDHAFDTPAPQGDAFSSPSSN